MKGRVGNILAQPFSQCTEDSKPCLGLQVVRAPKGDKDAQKGNAVSGLFDRARAAGAVDGKDEDLRRVPNTSGGGGRIFGGAARRLDGSDASEPQQAPASGPSTGPPQTVVHTITFYRNNIFTVDDGENPCPCILLRAVLIRKASD